VCALSACALGAAGAAGQPAADPRPRVEPTAGAAAFDAAAFDAAAIDAYLRPYVSSHNFAGTVLVARGGRVVYERSFGEADRATRTPHTAATRFHVASVSMQFTAAAVLRLVDRGDLRLDARVVDVVPDALAGVPGAAAITVRHLLEQRSGLPDVNERADYDSILARHQTPASLVATVRGQPLLFAPGAEHRHEEHTAYNVLALVLERRTGRPFAAALRALVFDPLGMTSAGADDDAPAPSPPVARGYQPRGVSGLEPARPIHWSAKAGSGSAYLSARDYARFAGALVGGRLLSDSLRAVVLDTAGPRVGYGWFRGARARFGQAAYYMNGRAPGFASFVLHLPREGVTVVAFSNVYASATTDLGYDVAAIATRRPYAPLALPARPAAGALALDGARFAFGPDFYQPNATLAFEARGDEMLLRWPSGDRSPLIPLDREHFIDRAYWVPVTVERDARDRAVAATYDRFRGVPPAGGARP
jgi:CubicO group peptidase (beta-lactamase class C family)